MIDEKGGAAPKVESTRTGRNFFFQRLEKAVQKVPISGIGGVVLVKIVARFFLFERKMVVFWDKDQIALRAAQIIARPVVVKVRCVVRTKRAARGVLLVYHPKWECIIFRDKNRKF